MLKKIFWVVLVFTAILWVGVGIYYFKTEKPSSAVNTSPRAIFQPTKGPIYESLERTHFVVGGFQAWEEIEGSQDRYILLINPATKRNYPKIRAILESRSPYKSNQFWEGMTTFAVEKTEKEHDDLGYLNEFTFQEIDKLIKKGDLVKIVFEKQSIIKMFEQDAEDWETKDLGGKADDILALSLSIKRPEGKAAIEQELGREI